jgi:hypothetical protein
MLDSDVNNADNGLHVEFYYDPDNKTAEVPFVRIQNPGDKLNIIERPVEEGDKQRFPRQWLYFQMKNSEGAVVGTPLSEWNKDAPSELNRGQLEELQILKFQTVEQVATASDSQMQKFGMGGAGLREKARLYLSNKNKSESAKELEKTRSELDELKAQMAELLAMKKSGKKLEA